MEVCYGYKEEGCNQEEGCNEAQDCTDAQGSYEEEGCTEAEEGRSEAQESSSEESCTEAEEGRSEAQEGNPQESLIATCLSGTRFPGSTKTSKSPGFPGFFLPAWMQVRRGAQGCAGATRLHGWSLTASCLSRHSYIPVHRRYGRSCTSLYSTMPGHPRQLLHASPTRRLLLMLYHLQPCSRGHRRPCRGKVRAARGREAGPGHVRERRTGGDGRSRRLPGYLQVQERFASAIFPDTK